jgi:Protein of unknown function (DUF3037)
MIGVWKMSFAKGYYSIIQYCPDPSRLESVNVGVALFSPELRFLRAKFGRSRTRISQLFGRQDWEFVELQKAAIEARLAQEQEAFKTLEEFQGYIARRANALVMTDPRMVKVEEPERELDQLLRRLVTSKRESVRRAAQATKELGTLLERAGIVSLLRPNVTVHPPSLPKPFKAPFAYQNGKLNLIEPVQFEGQSAETIFHRASVLAVEGEFLSDYKDPTLGDLGLVVVAKFSTGQQREQKSAAAVFEKHHVPMHTFGTLDPLFEEIRRSAH